MSDAADSDVATRLTGLCTFLVQAPPFEPGDEIEVVFARESAEGDSGGGWLPITATRPTEPRDALEGAERDWGREVVLVRARLSRTGGFPRDSMNRPSEEYDPDALSLSDVRVVDRSPPVEDSTAPDDRRRER